MKSLKLTSIELEAHLDADLNSHRLAIFCRWAEAPLLNGLNRLFVETHTDADELPDFPPEG